MCERFSVKESHKKGLNRGIAYCKNVSAVVDARFCHKHKQQVDRDNSCIHPTHINHSFKLRFTLIVMNSHYLELLFVAMIDFYKIILSVDMSLFR